MKHYEILKKFPGSNDGINVEQFEPGSVVELSDDLAAIAVAEGWAKETSAPVDDAPASTEQQPAEEPTHAPATEAPVDDAPGLTTASLKAEIPVEDETATEDESDTNAADDRKKKVVAPDHTKPKPKHKRK